MENWTGKVIRSYQLRELIGVGGFGIVHRAFQQVVNREVAIKIILPEYASKPSFIRNFEREAQLVARLEHPHIVPLFDYWRDPSGAYIVMRWLRGGSLQEALKQKGAWGITETAQLLEQIAGALTEAHRNNVVHQDIKAANILMDERGNAYLTDFGIAKDLSQQPEEEIEENGNSKREVHGSPEYMAPEQILNLAVDARADIYSLGVVVYEILTGEKPFHASNDEELVRRQLYEKLPSITLKRPDISPMFDIVIQRATDKNPKKRYPTPLAMAENFRQFVNAVTQSPTNIPTAEIPTPPAAEEKEISLDPVNPYKGLSAFQEADAEDFFGREKLVERLYLRMLEPGADGRFLTVIGPSGSGKSSVVRAGLIPMLRKNMPRWFLTDMTPDANPIRQLVEALLRIAIDGSLPYEDIIRADTNGLNIAVQKALGEGRTQLVLLIDQFEEMFTMVNDENERKHLIDSILQAVTAEDSRLRVILTLRADFYDRPLWYTGFSELVSRRTETVTPLTADELERAIVKPAERVGLTLEDGLVSEIIAEITGQAGTLPLLQYALTELFGQRSGATMTVKAYRASGGVTGAMTRRADTVYQNLTEPEKVATQQLFLRLVTLGEGTEDTRRRVLQSELAGIDVDQQHLQIVIDDFGKYRLLAFDREMTNREPTVEIAHEALIRNWKLLGGWLRDNRDMLRLQRRLAGLTEQWLHARRDSSFLVKGGQLSQFNELLDGKSVALSGDERDFLDASMQQELRAVRQRRRVIAALVIFSIVTGILAVYALDQRGRAVLARDRADAASLVSRSRELAIAGLRDTRDLDTALLLSVEAYSAADTFEARDALFTVLQSMPRLERFLQGSTNSVRTVAYSPDGRWIASGGLDNSVLIWDAETGQAYGEPKVLSDTVNSVAFSPDSSLLAAAADDGSLHVYNAESGELVYQKVVVASSALWRVRFSPDGLTIAVAENNGTVYFVDSQSGEISDKPLSGHEGAVYALAYSPDGQLIATGGLDSTVRLWDAATGELIGEPLTGHSNWVWSLAFSPDGTILASGGFDGTLILWNVEAQTAITEPLEGHGNYVRAVIFDSTGRLIFTAGEDGRIFVWNITNLQPALLAVSEQNSPVWAIALSPDGSRLVSANQTDSPQVWVLRETTHLRRSLGGFTQPIAAVAFDGVTSRVLAVGNNLTNANDLNTVQTWIDGQAQPAVSIAEDQPRLVTALVLSPDNQLIATADQTGLVLFNDAATGEQATVPLIANAGSVFALAFSPDGSMLATGGDRDGEIKLWVRSEDGSRWVQQGEALTGHIDRIFALAFSLDGRVLASASRDTTVRLWDVAGGTVLGEPLSGHTQPPISLAFSPNGAILASGGRDNRIVLWDVANRAQRQVLTGHTDWVWTLAFSPNGQYLASGSRDQAVLLWDARSTNLRQLGDAILLGSSVNALVFSPDSSHLVFGTDNGNVQVWNTDVESWKTRACLTANRNLMQTEWTAYLHDIPYQETCKRDDEG